MTKSKRVAILWILILGLFAAFTAVFWPVHFYQQTHAPENFIALAKETEAAAKNQIAINILSQGIQDFHPPYAEPYQLINKFEIANHPDSPPADILNPAFTRAEAFYTFTQSATPDLNIRYKGQPLESYPHGMQDAYLQCAKSLALAINVPWPANNTKQFPAKRWLIDSGMQINDMGRIGQADGPISNCNILVQSGGGEGASALAHIFVNGDDYALLGEGLQVVLVEQATGKVTAQQVFNLKAYEQEAHRLARFLEQAPKSTIGIFAIKGDVGNNMTDDATDALLNFGLRKEALIQYQHKLFGSRYSFAAIGINGKSKGQALQAWSPHEFLSPYGGIGYPGHPVACADIEPEPERDH